MKFSKIACIFAFYTSRGLNDNFYPMKKFILVLHYRKSVKNVQGAISI